MFTVCLRFNSLPSSGPFPGKDMRGYLANQLELHVKREVQGPQQETLASSSGLVFGKLGPVCVCVFAQLLSRV